VTEGGSSFSVEGGYFPPSSNLIIGVSEDCSLKYLDE